MIDTALGRVAESARPERKEPIRYEFSRMTRLPRTVWLVKRGPRPEHHRAPFHPVIICTRKHTADWEAGWTGERSWVWTHNGDTGHSGWLLHRWEGLVVDYGYLVRGCDLPDGTGTGFAHDRDKEPWSLLSGAVWWSYNPMPEWLSNQGVVLAEDDFTPHVIREDAGACALGYEREMQLKERRRSTSGRNDGQATVGSAVEGGV